MLKRWSNATAKQRELMPLLWRKANVRCSRASRQRLHAANACAWSQTMQWIFGYRRT